ncbi:hypothetical protein [Marinimicrobium sp. ABcell2]|uniref:hypothetical protein n=1 Tax=Marinimicrobium sp. ABcell2 TaxID=3069751 RepID=UPI0027B497E0|nr:hypothetical protein [Marinimicrobium sp. ABcell2]MDQ2077366.1 hypothetical protein [Marinimicrobium sp. ABcell2]
MNSNYFDLLLASQTISQVHALAVYSSEEGEYQLTATLKVHNDYRWVYVGDLVNSVLEARSTLTALIDCHLNQHQEDTDRMVAWKAIFDQTDLYKTPEGISVSFADEF